MRPRLLAAAVVTVASVAGALLVGAAPSSSAAKCAGAAARDLSHPCVNTTRTIRPTLANINKVTESPCSYRIERGLALCLFGTPPARAKGQVALIGDSHSWHWRAAVDYVARQKRWLGYSVTGPGCSFSEAVNYLPQGLRAPCVDYFAKTKAWLRRHPAVSTVFLSQLNSTPEEPPAGQTTFGLRVAGFQRAWTTGLPKTVKHVVVISDVPAPTSDTLACIGRVLGSAGPAPGTACALPRSQALTTDVGGAAVAALHSKRYAYVDMSQYFCDAALCYPVVGGVLVYRDIDGHITPAYSASLGPYLFRKVQLLMVSW
jgi:hypothetical protein